MKKINFLIIFLLITATIFAQSPQKISYQAVIRDANQNLVTGTNVGLRIQILQYSEFGAAVYVETHTPPANENGLITLEIGGGTVVNGDFSSIDWADGPYFIKTETDPTGGTNYNIVGTSELLSVPYALFSLNGTPGPEGPEGPPGADGLDGADGLSAYEIWLDLGNTGTEEEFIESLVGPAGVDGLDGEDGLSVYEIWLDLGNTGTEEEFIESLVGPAGVDGLDGEDGLSAYEIWLDLGNTGTEDDFIASLEGPAGQDGSAKAIEMAGYDLSAGLTVTSTTYQMWNSAIYGNNSVTVGTDDKILVTVSAMVFKTGDAASNTLHVEICPCYSETFTDPVVTPFTGRTRARFLSSGGTEMNQISSVYVFSNLEGTYNFSLCLKKISANDPDFVMYAPKLSVVVY